VKVKISSSGIFLTMSLIVACFALRGQDSSAKSDLKNLSGIEFFKKYSFYDKTISSEDIRVTKLVWSLEQVSSIDKALRQNGVRTFTRIDDKPSKENPYYIIGHYQQPTPDHLARMSYYRVNILEKTIDYQSLDDFVIDKWSRID
jgi:hypothetical protein